MVDLQIKSLTFLIVFYYLPPDNSYKFKMRKLFEEIEELSVKYEKVIAMGDANGWTGEENAVFGRSRSSKDTRVNVRGKAFLEESERAGVSIGNGCIEGDLCGEITYTCMANGKPGSSVIDLCLLSPAALALAEEFKVLDYPYSNHDPILLTISCPLPFPIQSKSLRQIFKFPSAPYEISTFKQALNEKLGEVNTNLNSNELSRVISNGVMEVAAEHKLLKMVGGNSNKPRWHDKDCASLKQEMTKSKRRFRRVKTHAVKASLRLEEFLVAKSTYLCVCDIKQREFMAKREERICNANPPQEFWHEVKSLS